MDESPRPADVPEAQSEPTTGGGFSWYVWLLVFLLVVYPLSIGPAAKLHKACPAARPTIELMYKPVTLIIDHCPRAEALFIWYIAMVWKAG